MNTNNVFKGILSSTLLLCLISCTQINGTSLLTDQSSDPSEHAIDRTPRSQELLVKVHNSAIQAVGREIAEVSGDCFQSTYPSHRIELLQLPAQTRMNFIDLNGAAGYTIAGVCKSGRFLVAIPSPGSGHYSYRLRMVGIDSNNQDVSNAAQGVANVNVQF